MKKFFIVFFVIFFSVANIAYSNANNDQKVVAILDTYVDSSMSDRIIYEVCVVLDRSCLNNSSFMEGRGAANVLPTDLTAKGIDHGPQMAATALQANPNTKIVFVRIHNVHRYPKFNAIYASDESIANGLRWVSENAQKYSIDSVSISQARTNFASGTCPKNTQIEQYVQSLKSLSIPVFAGAGNGGWWNRTGFPACSTDVIGIGSSNSSVTLGTSNMGVGVDFYSIGTIQLFNLNNIRVTGTSVATAYIASVWANKFFGTWQNQYDLANSSTTMVTHTRSGQKFKLIDN
jgi:hypothetical protein